MLSPLAATIVGEVGDKALNVVKALTQKEKSLLDFIRVGQVTPMVIVDSDIRHNPTTKDILHVLSTLFTAYYMQALVYEDLIDDVRITQRLEKFNPAQSKPLFKSIGLESLGGYGLGPTTKAGLEAYDKGRTGGGSDVFTKENTAELYEDRSLAVGKTITIKLHDRAGNPRPTPVTIRLVPMTMDSSALLSAYSLGSRWNTESERKHRVNQGELHWFWDYWLKRDLIREHQRALVNDKSGVYAALSDRRSSKLVSAIVNGEQSVAAAAAMSIVSAKTAKELERRLGGKLSNYKTREQLFESTGLMLMVVFDPNFEQMTFYYSGTPDASQLSVSEVKSSGKKQDVNVMELINTFMNKGAPSF